MICPFHKVEMREMPERDHRVAPLHRCPICTEEFRAKFDRALNNPNRRGVEVERLAMIRHARRNSRRHYRPDNSPRISDLGAVVGDPSLPMRPLNWDAPVWPNWKRVGIITGSVALLAVVTFLAWPRGLMRAQQMIWPLILIGVGIVVVCHALGRSGSHQRL